MGAQAIQLEDGLSGSRNLARVNSNGELLVSAVITSGGGSGGGGTEFAEDSVHASGALGTLTLAVRNDAGTSLVGADGDYASLQVDSTGALRTAVTFPSSITVDGSVSITGTAAVTQSGAWAVSVSNFPATQPVSIAATVTVDGTVAATQSGSWSVDVDNFPATQTVDDGGGSLTVDGTVTVGNATLAVTQSGAWAVSVSNLPATQTVDGSVSIGAEHLEDSPHSTGDTGVLFLAVRNDSGSGLVDTNGDYAPPSIDSAGRLIVSPISGDPSNFTSTVRLRDFTNSTKGMHIVEDGDTVSTLAPILGPVPFLEYVTEELASGVGTEQEFGFPTMDVDRRIRVDTSGSVTISQLTPGVGINDLGKGEDSAHVSGSTGMMPLAVQRSTPVSGSSDGDYSTFNVDNLGRLWVRNSEFTTEALSGSTRGRPIQLTGTATGSANTLHTATTTTGELDRVFIDLTNTSSEEVVVTIEFGATGTGNQVSVTVPPNSTIPAIEGMVIGGAATDTIRAYAETGNVVNAIGRVETLL